jgi:transposase
MSHRKLLDAERWQAVGMVRGGMSYIKTAERFNVSHSVIVRLKQCVNQTGSVKERQRTGKPLKTTTKENGLIKRLARQWSFSTANTLRSRWIVNRRISRRTLKRRLTNTKFRAKASATDNTPQNNQALIGTLPYGMEYQVVAEGALAG